MAFWLLATLTGIFALVRFAPLRRHLGIGLATFVLILRLFALAIAVLLAAPFFVSSSQTVKQPSRIAVLIDSSTSVDANVRQQAIRALIETLGGRKSSILAWEFSDTLRPINLDNFSRLSTGRESKLSKSILAAIEASQPDEILLLTDAQDTDPASDELILAALRKSGTKLNAVILPNNLPPNISLSASPTQVFLFPGEKTKLSVQISSERLKDEIVAQLRVWEGNRLANQVKLPLAKGVVQTTIELEPSSAGWNRYRFEVLPIKGEIWTEDNGLEVLIWRAKTKLRVFIITGQPNFEFKFVKQAIESEPNFEWVAVASLPDGTRYQQGSPQLVPASLMRPEKFHVVAVIAPDAEDFGAAEGKALWQFVQNGGGLFLTLSEPTIRTNGWRFFVPYPLTFAPLPSPAPISPVKEDPLGSQLLQLPKVDLAWTITKLPNFVQTALQSSGKPVLVWWQEGLGKVAIAAFDGSWRWAMEAARKGEQPESHRKFWRTVVRFLADPMKGEWEKMSKLEVNLKTPKPPPPELSSLPNIKRIEAWAKVTGGQVLKPEEVSSWAETLSLTKTVKVSTKQPISAFPLPYLLLLAALTVEWWLIRRSGLT